MGRCGLCCRRRRGRDLVELPSSVQTKECFVSFDAIAPVYRQLEAAMAGSILQKCRLSHMSAAVGGAQALLLGEGPGRFLIELLRRDPSVCVTCVEQSPAMILQAKRQVRRYGLDSSRIEFCQTDALKWNPAGQVYDIIVTHFFLDCFRPEELHALVAKVGTSARADARWLVGDFCIPECGWRRKRARAIHAAMYAFFRAVTGLSAKQVTPPDDALNAVGFRLVSRRHFNFGLLHSDLWVKQNS